MSAHLAGPAKVAASLLLLASAGCGQPADVQPADPGPAAVTSSAEAGGTGRAVAPDGPRCREVWRDGARLPHRYTGCYRDGEFVEARKQRCAVGQVLVTYAGRYYAVLGGPVNDEGALADSRRYRRAADVCSG